MYVPEYSVLPLINQTIIVKNKRIRADTTIEPIRKPILYPFIPSLIRNIKVEIPITIEAKIQLTFDNLNPFFSSSIAIIQNDAQRVRV